MFDLGRSLMFDHEPTARSRALGTALRREALEHFASATELAERLAWSPSKMSRIFLGKRPASTVDIAAVLAMCGVTGRRRAALLDLASEARRSNLVLDDGDELDRTEVLADLEDDAVAITNVAPFVMPDVGRLSVLDRDRPPACRFFIDEAVVMRSYVDGAARSDQLHHLLQLSVRETVSVQVIPSSDRIPCESFEILDFGTESAPIVCLESLAATQFLEGPHTVGAYMGLVSRLDAAALSADRTRAWFIRLAADIDADGDPLCAGPDAPAATP
jgi:hypothetical protein